MSQVTNGVGPALLGAMPRPWRVEFAGASYHVINRGNYRRNLLAGKGAAEAFERTLGEAAPSCPRWPRASASAGSLAPPRPASAQTPPPRLSPLTDSAGNCPG